MAGGLGLGDDELDDVELEIGGADNEAAEAAGAARCGGHVLAGDARPDVGQPLRPLHPPGHRPHRHEHSHHPATAAADSLASDAGRGSDLCRRVASTSRTPSDVTTTP